MENSELLNLAREFLDYKNGQLFWNRDIKYTKIKAGDRAGCLKRDGYRYIQLKGKRYLEHRIIYFLHNTTWDINDRSQQIDHINRIKDDNRIENLRLVTGQENQFNRGARGYYWDKQMQKWRAQIMIDGKNIHLGNFDYKTGARLAYVTAEKKHHIIEVRK